MLGNFYTTKLHPKEMFLKQVQNSHTYIYKAGLYECICYGVYRGEKTAAQEVKCLACKHEELSPVTRKPSSVTHTYNPSAGRTETRESTRLIGQPT